MYKTVNNAYHRLHQDTLSNIYLGGGGGGGISEYYLMHLIKTMVGMI